jgi:hypothetical protein
VSYDPDQKLQKGFKSDPFRHVLSGFPPTPYFWARINPSWRTVSPSPKLLQSNRHNLSR